MSHASTDDPLFAAPEPAGEPGPSGPPEATAGDATPFGDVAARPGGAEARGPEPGGTAPSDPGTPDFSTADHGAPRPGEPEPASTTRRHAGADSRPRVPGRAVAGIAVASLALGLAGGVAGDRLSELERHGRTSDSALPVAAPVAASRPAGSVAALAAAVLPSVVSIAVVGKDGTATGSGFVVRADGYLLTNNHVVAETAHGAKATVTFADGHQEAATVVGRTVDYDLAVVKVEESGLPVLRLGDSDTVAVGDAVLAVGAPLGLDSTVTTGIVSATHRPVQAGEAAQAAYIDALQTDAAINPGNSGGPLVDANGRVVGINSAIAQPPGAVQATGSIGLGFAIPSNQARHTAEQLIATGTATYPVIGVLLDPSYSGEGVRVATGPQQGRPAVTPGGPADAAGIRPGDVILAIDGRPVSESDELIVAIRAQAPGDAVTLRVRTRGAERDVRVVLDEQSSK